MDIPFIGQQQLSTLLEYPKLIAALERSFGEDGIHTPQRHHHDYINPISDKDSTLLLMPSWEEGNALGVKLVTINPENHNQDLPSIQGVYVLFDEHGTPRLILDARELTVKRTAATSALASAYLSREDSSKLMIIGTGALSGELIRAHASLRKIERVMVWGRDSSKAQDIVSKYADSDYTVETTESIEAGLKEADIVSVATMSEKPLVLGEYLREGQHLDLVGSYKPDMREADDAAIMRSQVYIDSEMAKKESGDLAIPLGKKVINEDHIRGTLFDLCQKKVKGRRSDREITYFKSVGHALEDLVAARMTLEFLKPTGSS